MNSKPRKASDKNNSDVVEDSAIFKLIHVGSPFINISTGLYNIPCYFQAWLTEENKPVDASILPHNAPNSLAGELVVGSLWTHWNKLITAKYSDDTESKVFWAGASELFIVKLQDVLDPAALEPAIFWSTQGNTWVISIAFGGHQIIIPYFELVRTLFYSASRRLTRFFFSQLPLDLLCIPLTAPTAANGWLGRFCVASRKLTAAEARVLGGVLFDPELRRVFDYAQSHRLSQDQSGKPEDSHDLGVKNIGHFTKNILFRATGQTFIHNDASFFWVSSLEAINSIHCVQQFVFHPLTSNISQSATIDKIPVCSDLLGSTIQSTERAGTDGLPDGAPFPRLPVKSTKKPAASGPLRSTPRRPAVVCAVPWASSPLDKRKFYWLKQELSRKVLQRFHSLPGNELHSTAEFYELINQFKRLGYKTRYLSVNNAQGAFGEGLSIFPENELTTTTSMHPFSLAEISLSNGPLFLFQPFPDTCKDMVVLCRKQDLSAPTNNEWNALLNNTTPVHDELDFDVLRRTVDAINRKYAASNTALTALAIPIKNATLALCLDYANHLLETFRNRLRFFIYSTINYPTGMSAKQRQRVISRSRNLCTSPSSQWIKRATTFWSVYRSENT